MIKSAIFHSGERVPENGLLSENKSCPFCDSAKRNKSLSLQDSPEVFLYKCEECGAFSANRMPKSIILDNYYAKYYDQASTKNVTFDNVTRFAKHLYKIVISDSVIHGPTYRLLDFGGGDGSMAIELARILIDQREDLSVDIIVIDYSSVRNLKNESRVNIKSFKSIDEVEINSCDFVIASAIIEHIPYPKEIIQQLFSVLKEEGLFYARTPAMVPLFKIFRLFGVSFDFTFPGHIHDLGEGFWGNFVNLLNTNWGIKAEMIKSRPSIVETSFNTHFLRSFVAHVMKFPWHIFGRYYGLVGGWEVFIKKNRNDN